MEFLGDMMVRGIVPNLFRCDNAEENKSFDRGQNCKGCGVTFEYTALNMPQQNGVAKRAFATLYGRTRAAFTATGLPECMKKELSAEGVHTSILQWHGDKDWAAKQPQDVLRAGGSQAAKRYTIFVGFLQDHANVYQFYNPVTCNIIQPRDVILLGKLYREYVENSLNILAPLPLCLTIHRMSRKLKRKRSQVRVM